MYKFQRNFQVTVESATAQFILPKELKYEFTTNNLEKRPGQCTLRIFNASPATVSSLYEGTILTLKAGYQDSASAVIFRGQITNYIAYRQGPDLVTELYLADWAHAYSADCTTVKADSSTVSRLVFDIASLMVAEVQPKKGTGGKSYSVNVEVSTVNIKIGTLGNLQPSGVQAPTGTCRNYLNYLAGQYGFTWWIQNGTFYARENNAAQDSTTKAYIVKADTGMISTPMITAKGVDVVTLLEASLVVGSIFEPTMDRSGINVADKFYAPQQFFKERQSWLQRAHQVIHKGDTRGNQWQTEIIGMHVYTGGTDGAGESVRI